MSEMWYEGAHSISFKGDGDEDYLNTWDHWRLAPKERPVVNPPEPKKEYVDVPGADGSLDYTEILGKVRYQNRTGSWTFLIDHTYWDWPTLYTDFMEKYQGRMLQIVFSDDPEYYYRGRIEINAFNQEKDWSSFTINYTLEPYKWPLASSRDKEWLWDELFNTPTYFGPIIVDGDVERNILNPDKDEEQPVNIYSTDDMDFDVYKYTRVPTYNQYSPWMNVIELEDKIDGKETIAAGENEAMFSLKPGEVKLLRLSGTGLVKIDIGSGKRL